MIKTFIIGILHLILLSANSESLISQSEYIRKITEDLQANLIVNIEGQQLYCTKLLSEFYSGRNFEPAWKNNLNIIRFMEEISRAPESGLHPEDYHYETIITLNDNTRSSEERAGLDLLLTDAFFLYSSHLLNGKVNPETLDSEWKATRRENIPIELAEKIISGKSIGRFLASQEPQDESYQYLKKALRAFKAISKNGGWPVIPEGITLKIGMEDSIRIPLLILRLNITGELPGEYENLNDQYTVELSSAVKKYQVKNGLEVDGNLGKKTTASLNMSVEQQIDKIIVNLERHRWIAHDLGDKYIFVNIAAFQLKVVEKREVLLSEKVIVGKPFRKTPLFSSQMTYFVLNPYWTVPSVILYNDILPEMKKDPGYLATKHIRVLMGNGSEAREIDPSALDWSGFYKGNFPYTLRQDPGKFNALGQIKFMFPNKYNVYIHDTPAKELFNKSERTFSSGCIRLNNPMALLEYLIRDDPGLSMEKINQYLSLGKEHTIILKNPLNVHIQYLTCWAENDIIQFRNDVYDRDKAILKALNDLPSNL